MKFDKDKLLNLHLDYPGILISGELSALKVFLSSLNDYVPHICDQYKLKESRKAENNSDDEYPQALHQELAHIDEISKYVIPNMFNYSAVLMMWSFFESSSKDLAAYIRKMKDVELSIKDISGEGLTRIERYYSKVLGQSKLIQPHFNELTNIYLIRNLIVHGNGVITSSYESQRKQTEKSKLVKYINSNKYLDIRDGHLYIEKNYIEESFMVIKCAVKDVDNYIANENDWMELIT